jgi:hypothetical protein
MMSVMFGFSGSLINAMEKIKSGPGANFTFTITNNSKKRFYLQPRTKKIRGDSTLLEAGKTVIFEDLRGEYVVEGEISAPFVVIQSEDKKEIGHILPLVANNFNTAEVSLSIDRKSTTEKFTIKYKIDATIAEDPAQNTISLQIIQESIK